MKEERVARRLTVNGIVQGVGFRPFVFRLAGVHNLKGQVANSADGVAVHLEGTPEDIQAFRDQLVGKAPPLAHITGTEDRAAEIKHFHDFSIAPSERATPARTAVSPDMAFCDDCLEELLDPGDRRCGYPFINCTNCGPRYTLITDAPYDRSGTTMNKFVMCAACQAEYDNPFHRRFHAQPNACPACGPGVALLDGGCRKLDADHPVEASAQLLRDGHILAVKGIGGYHLAADAENSRAVETLRGRKRRRDKPFALMSLTPAAVRSYAHADAEEGRLLASPQRPIVILKKKTPNRISPAVAPAAPGYGVMLPFAPLHVLLLKHGFLALVMTSGNLSGDPMALDDREAFFRLGGVADYFLTHNRDICQRCDDSIVKKSAGRPRIIRRSRGYAPAPVMLDRQVPPTLACGAGMKSTVCLAGGDKAFLSQHIGDLESADAHDFFESTIGHLQRILGIRPEIVALDAHPDYFSSRYAKKQDHLAQFMVQHHHAHIASAMAENKIDGPVIGLAFDGTGYGTDGTLWGGEVLVAGGSGFHRIAHLNPVSMPGGSAAVREPWRMAASYLFSALGDLFWELDLPLFKEVDRRMLNGAVEMIRKGINCPLTSSLGRLFDGVAAIAGTRFCASYEGQAAMELEALAARDASEMYPFRWDDAGVLEIPCGPIIRGAARDAAAGVAPAVIAGRFHRTLICLFTQLCREVRRRTGLKRVVLSGGVFQNDLLLAGMVQRLARAGFSVFANSQVPANDGGISLGQVLVAAAHAGSGGGGFMGLG